MLFTTPGFLVFLAIFMLLFFLVPAKWRRFVLFAASFVFYGFFRLKQVAILILVTLVSYGLGIDIEKEADHEKKKKRIVATGIILAAGCLVLYKYLDFLFGSISAVSMLLGGPSVETPFSLVMPVGVSYFTFQIIAYLADIARGDIKAERNFIDYAIYITFFPKIISGPIERAGSFLKQVKESADVNLWDADRVYDGFVRLTFGFMQKLVIADRLAIFTNETFSHFSELGSIELWLAMAAYYLQLYMDFAGYTNMALGVAKMIGFDLTENFRNPFLSKNVKEYWTRWHISLSTWLRDYIYIPLGGNRGGKLKKYRNILITFLISGLWHGAGWRYVFWGGLHGIFQVTEYVAEPGFSRFGEKHAIKKDACWLSFIRRAKTWIIVGIAYIFFQIPSAREGVIFIYRMLTKWKLSVLRDGTLFSFGVPLPYMVVVLLATAFVLWAEYMTERRELSLGRLLCTCGLPIRFGILLVTILCIALFGAYGPGYDAANFIYFGF